uniref:Beta-galactosidase n=2 Tax=Clytia hemisphaerica TaxID=252671 RepID=A0A7M5X9T6_9CNID
MAEKTSHTSSLKIKGKDFVLEGKPFQILCGAIHYFRITPDSWDDRIKKAKGMGLNSVDIYIPWNLHEPQPGKFSTTYAKQLRMFMDLLKSNDMYAVMRPGPYICSEWDLGGLPSWLLSDDSMKIRSLYSGFTTAVTRYFNHLLPILEPYQHSKGGPIIAFQVENEYGSFGTDGKYMDFIQNEFRRHGLHELHFICDNMEGIGNYEMKEQVFQTINFMTKAEEAVGKLLEIQPNKPVFVTEFWDGWFTHWGEQYHYVGAERLTKTLDYMLKHGYSVNFYMFHGGTNFGFYNGANANDDGSNYQCDITSYDYDAPVSEGGDLNTKKYNLFKKTIQHYTTKEPEKQSFDENYKHNYGNIELKYQTTLSQLLKDSDMHKEVREAICNMESVKMADGSSQQYGYVVYETVVTKGAKLHIKNARDFVFVLINDRLVETVLNIQKAITVNVEGYIRTGSANNIKILVENAGRVNYGKDIGNQRKGILGGVTLDNSDATGWTIYPLQFDEDLVSKLENNPTLWEPSDGEKENSQPTLYKGFLNIDGPPKDTYFKTRGWFKGVIFVNGKNLGRYWKRGPQFTLYVPKQWLKSGINTVLVFDLHGEQSHHCDGFPCIESVDTPDVGAKKEFHI